VFIEIYQWINLMCFFYEKHQNYKNGDKDNEYYYYL